MMIPYPLPVQWLSALLLDRQRPGFDSLLGHSFSSTGKWDRWDAKVERSIARKIPHSFRVNRLLS